MLGVYRNNVIDWVIAESPEDAARAWEEHMGVSWDDATDDGPPEWVRLPDDQVLRINEEGTVVEKTCAEWVRDQGRGFLGSTEY